MKKSLFALSGLLLTIFLTWKCTSTPHPTADILLENATFFTAENTDTAQKVEAVGIRDGKICFVGSRTDAEKWVGNNTRVMNLQGNFVMPGFIEGHGHYESLGRSLLNINLLDTKSWQEVVERVAQKVAATPAGEWVEGRGWHQEKWQVLPQQTVGGYPLHHDLSKSSPENPVILYHASGHSLFANERAMQLAGISKETREPSGGRIVRDAAGNAVGVFEENAMSLIENAYQKAKNQRSDAEREAYFDRCIDAAGQLCWSHGITSFQDAGSDFWEIEQYERLAAAGKLHQRLWVMMMQPSQRDFGKMSAFPKIGLGNGMLTVRAVKCYLDGALGSYGAWLLEEYTDKRGFFGQNTTPIDSIRLVAEQCKKLGLQCCVHAIGDRSNREMLQLFENVAGGESLRWRIEHAQHIDLQDIARFGKLGIVASMQAIHCTSDAPFVVKRLGEERARTGAYAWRSLLDSGAHLANGTDAPVEEVNPLACLYASVTRKRADADLVFFPEQCMTRREALLSYTLWNAWAAFEEQEKGSISVGKWADFVVLDKNLLTCPPEDILKAKVLTTMLAGKVKFQQ